VLTGYVVRADTLADAMKLVEGKTALADQERGPLLAPKLSLLKAICMCEQSR